MYFSPASKTILESLLALPGCSRHETIQLEWRERGDTLLYIIKNTSFPERLKERKSNMVHGDIKDG